MILKADVINSLLRFINNNGGTIINSHPRYKAIRARIPIDFIERLSSWYVVKSIRPADVMMTNMTNTSEGDVAHMADLARSSFGVDGSSINIGVLSDSVDALASLQASGDLPAGVTVLPGQSGNPGTSEGTAMLEIIHDLAPGANLFFATAFGGEAQFAQNILDLFAAGCDIIVDDVAYFSEGVFQDDIVAQAVNTVTAGGAFYFSSAGNSGNFNDSTSGVWEGDFNTAASQPAALTGFNVHDFGGGITGNLITVDSPFFFVLSWADPLGASANDYDLFLLNAVGDTVIASSTNIQDGNDDPFEFISSQGVNDAGLLLVIVKTTGDDRYLHLNTSRGQLSIATAGQTSGHNSAEQAFGVAAVSAALGLPTGFDGTEQVETFSSDGPRKIFFEANGTPITAGDFSSSGGVDRQKPDIAAADGVSTATPGFNPFFGTSAAAPHAAAIAALILEADPTLSQAEMRAILTGTAIDIEAIGPDRDSGAGIIDAFAAVNAALPPEPLAGDFNEDGCVDRSDLNLILAEVRTNSGDLGFDLNEDNALNIADARFLVTLFTNPRGAPCLAE